ncbi:MAG: RNA polymerase sigma factor [Phycisphaerales bacterium]|nr:RNA polymerase sigma factor [Phycisphaerales bacterium]
MTSSEITDVFNSHRCAVHAWAYRIVGNHHDAADVTQEVFLKWWRAYRDGSAPANAVGWLRRVTINHSIGAVRSDRRRDQRRPEPGRSIAAPPDADAERRELAVAVAAALDEITESQREVLVAKVYDGWTFAEIAGQLGLAVPTVKTHYLRAINAVRAQLTARGIVQGAADDLQ